MPHVVVQLVEAELNLMLGNLTEPKVFCLNLTLRIKPRVFYLCVG